MMSPFEVTSRRRLVAGSMLGIGVALSLVLFFIANYLGWKYHYRFDWTRTKIYSLSEKTENILRNLDRDIEVVVFLSPADELYGPVNELLMAYGDASGRLKIRQVDPEKNLAEAQSMVDRFELSKLNVVVFDTGEDRRVVDAVDLAEYDYSGMQLGQAPSLTGFKGEQLFTSALIDLLESRKPKILFTSGHGELQLEDFSPRGLSLARDLLGRDNFDLDSWSSLGEETVPEGTDLLVIAGPTSTFVEPEVELLRSYLSTGGRLLVLIDPALAPSGGLTKTGLEALLAEYGIDVGDDIVVDPASPLPFFSAETIFVTTYGEHVITRTLDQAQLPVIVAMARSIRAGEEIGGLTSSELMMTTVEGWGETNLANLSKVERSDEDVQGPVPLAIAVEAAEVDLSAIGSEAAVADERPSAEEDELEMTPEDETPADPEAGVRLVVVGDSDFATNGQVQNVPNATFLANCLNWLIERETLVGIPPKEPEQVRLSLTRQELSRITWLVLAVLPGLTIALGLAVYLQRRR